MQRNNKSALTSPLANRVVLLNKQLAFYGAQMPHGKKRKNSDGTFRMTVDVRRGYLYPLLEKGNLLVYFRECIGHVIMQIKDVYKPHNVRFRELRILTKTQNRFEYDYKTKCCNEQRAA